MSRAAVQPREAPSHPQVWKATEMAGLAGQAVPTGHPALDAVLPGGGWPVGSLVEVLQPPSARLEWQLVLPGLAAAPDGPVVLVAPPHEPFGPALASQGLSLSRLIRIDAPKPAACLWACEQGLRCREVSAVLAWLPQVRQAELRRLHLAAAQHAKLLFVFRGLASRAESSPAQVRLALQRDETSLQVEVLKRRGPPLAAPLRLAAHPPRLSALLAARSGRSSVAGQPLPSERPDVLDRTAALA